MPGARFPLVFSRVDQGGAEDCETTGIRRLCLPCDVGSGPYQCLLAETEEGSNEARSRGKGNNTLVPKTNVGAEYPPVDGCHVVMHSSVDTRGETAC